MKNLDLEIYTNNSCDGDLVIVKSTKYPFFSRYIKNHFNYDHLTEDLEYDFEVRKPEYYNNSSIVIGYKDLKPAFNEAKGNVLNEIKTFNAILNEIKNVGNLNNYKEFFNYLFTLINCQEFDFHPYYLDFNDNILEVDFNLDNLNHCDDDLFIFEFKSQNLTIETKQTLDLIIKNITKN